jgi:hypothetical protein
VIESYLLLGRMAIRPYYTRFLIQRVWPS